MNKLNNLLNYERITSFVFDKDDFVSERIITFYQEYLFSGIYKPSAKNIKLIDEIIGEYTKKTKFYDFVKKKLTALELTNSDIDYYHNLDVNLKKMYKEFNNQIQVSNTKWL